MSVDAFTLAVVHSSLIAIARDMKIMTMRTAYTQLWKEQGDLSCCLMDANGDIIAQDPNGFPFMSRPCHYNYRAWWKSSAGKI